MNRVPECLEELGILRQHLCQLLQQWNQVRCTYEKMTALYGKEPVCSGTVDTKERILAALADLETTIERSKNNLARAEREADTFLRSVAHAPEKFAQRDAAILRLRYLRGYSWEDVWKHMKWQGYSVGNLRTLYNWHRQALERAAACSQKINEIS